MIKFTKSDAGRNSYGFFDERNDCGVRALATVTGSSYGDAHIFWEELGRNKGSGVSVDWLDDYLVKNNNTVFGYKVTKTAFPFTKLQTHEWSHEEKKYIKHTKRVNVKTFIEQHPTGKYIIITHNHAKAIVNSEIIDHDFGVYSEIRYVYEFAQ
jgi:hypothetical protein